MVESRAETIDPLAAGVFSMLRLAGLEGNSIPTATNLLRGVRGGGAAWRVSSCSVEEFQVESLELLSVLFESSHHR